MTFVLVLLAIWLILSILGLVVKGLFWLFIIAAILFIATAIWGWVKRKTSSGTSH